MDGFVRACAVSDVALNENRCVEINGREILICHTRDGFFAVDNICTHQLQSLDGGKIRGCYIFCPLHGQRFHLKDGKPIGKLTDKPLPVFNLRVAEGDVYVRPVPVDFHAQGAMSGAGPD